MTRTVLVVDDEPNMRWVLGRALEQAGYTVYGAERGDDCLTTLTREPVDLVLLDLKLRSEDGITVLRRIRERRPETVVMILTAYGTVPTAVEAMQLGAADFLRKPFDVEEVVFKIARALERRAMQAEIARLSLLQRSVPAFEALIGVEPVWQQLVEQARQAALTNSNVLLVGEAGSGRTSIARAMYIASARASAPLLEVDLKMYHSRAQTTALFGERGNGGIWADAGSGSLILRGLVDAPDVHAAVAERLSGRPAHSGPRLFLIVTPEDRLPESLEVLLPIRLYVPPLRERPRDIALLTLSFAPEHAFTPPALQALERYNWSGNVTELRAVVERAARLAGSAPIDVHHLPEQLRNPPTPPMHSPFSLPPEGVQLEQVEQALIQQALERAHGNKSRAAELLGLTRHTLLYRMEKYGIQMPDQR